MRLVDVCGERAEAEAQCQAVGEFDAKAGEELHVSGKSRGTLLPSIECISALHFAHLNFATLSSKDGSGNQR